ncbi:MAG: glycosidase, partial [Flavobacteriaceae bacterium]|nr:glycosidase [Flavobacteriaceae bacterium]
MKKLNHLFSIATLFTILSCQNTPQIQEEQSWQLGPFEKLDKVNPILKPSTDLSFMDPIRKEEVFFEEKNVLNPTAVVKDGKVYLLYRAQDSMMTSRIALAISTDGVHFEKQAAPV